MRTYSPSYLQSLSSMIFEACGAPGIDAKTVAEHLVTANLMGLDSHGVIRVPQYVQDMREGVIIAGAPMRILQQTSTTAIVDGGWNFGQVVALRATEIAVEKAGANALACVALRRCRHVGVAGLYPRLAAERGCVALALCSTAGEGQRVCPWGGKEGRLAPNPIAFAAPTGGNPILLDFSTSMASEGKIRLLLNRDEQLPEGWIVNGRGRPSTDPHDLYGPPAGAILPFGSNQGYKGFALSLMAQILSSLLGEPAWREEGLESKANNMQLLALDINAFMPLAEFRHEMDDLIEYIRSSALAEGFSEIVIPGELNFRQMEDRKTYGIRVDDETWRQIEQAAQQLGVEVGTES